MHLVKQLALFLAIASTVCVTLPAQAQYSIVGEQPAVGGLHVKEAHLLAQLNRDYQLGLVDPFELANMTRDLDAIRVREEAFRMRKQGMTPRAMEKIAKDLASFQADLNNRTNEKAMTIAQQ